MFRDLLYSTSLSYYVPFLRRRRPVRAAGVINKSNLYKLHDVPICSEKILYKLSWAWAWVWMSQLIYVVQVRTFCHNYHTCGHMLPHLATLAHERWLWAWVWMSPASASPFFVPRRPACAGTCMWSARGAAHVRVPSAPPCNPLASVDTCLILLISHPLWCLAIRQSLKCVCSTCMSTSQGLQNWPWEN